MPKQDERPVISDKEMRRKFKAFLRLPPSGTDFAEFKKADWVSLEEILRGMRPVKLG